jgi:hypothetical protein
MNFKPSIVLVGTLLASFLRCAAPEPPVDPAPVAEPAEAPLDSPEKELAQIKTRLETVKTRLFDQGKYNCCVQPSCDWCALHEGSCECFSNLQAEDAVCPGCGLGWHNGQGIVEGVDAKSVKWNITHEHAPGGHQH